MLARKWGRADLMSKSLIFINTGSNDLFEYTFSDHNCSRNDTEFLQSLVASYRSFLMVRVSPKCSFTSKQIHSGLSSMVALVFMHIFSLVFMHIFLSYCTNSFRSCIDVVFSFLSNPFL